MDGLNVYAYVLNAPTEHVDVLGLQGLSAMRDDMGEYDSVHLRRCISCHNPVMMHGGRVADLPADLQLGVYRATRTTNPQAADRAIGMLRQKGRATRRFVAEGTLLYLTGDLGAIGTAGRTGAALWGARGINAGVTGLKYGTISEGYGWAVGGETPSAERFGEKVVVVGAMDLSVGTLGTIARRVRCVSRAPRTGAGKTIYGVQDDIFKIWASQRAWGGPGGFAGVRFGFWF